jgi:hypothetical protein
MMICKSTVRFRHARRHALRQYLTGSVHIIVAMVMRKETSDGQRLGNGVLPARDFRKFEKPLSLRLV